MHSARALALAHEIRTTESRAQITISVEQIVGRSVANAARMCKWPASTQILRDALYSCHRKHIRLQCAPNAAHAIFAVAAIFSCVVVIGAQRT